MQRVTPDRPWPLFDAAGTRVIEQAAAPTLPSHALMQRAGLAVARLALALTPHARHFWIACGPGNNGGDGLEAAVHLKRWGKLPVVSWAGDESRAPADALASLAKARAARVDFTPEPPAHWEFAIDALLGLGAARALEGNLLQYAQALNARSADVLAVDLPSGLDADTGVAQGVFAANTLSLLTLKPGLFTASGLDAAGTLWFDDLGVPASPTAPVALLAGPPARATRTHASHKGSYGDVAVIGGAPGMAGAALLAASAALHAGAGRVYAALLDASHRCVDPLQPELMFRPWDTLDLAAMSVACGCGGGNAVRATLPRVISTARALVLDADALNAIASDTQLQSLLQARAKRGRSTVLTPHPLEAGRLLGCNAAQVQTDRLGASRELVQRFGGVVVLKGSGSITSAPGKLPVINPTGNARLATAGTGDVLAGMIAARLAAGIEAFDAAAGTVYEHGRLADAWPLERPLTANALARSQ